MELAPAVVLFLEAECLREEVEAFLVCKRLIQEDPIKYSQPYLGPTDHPSTLRYFRFGGCLALFEYRWTGDSRTDLIRVLACRRKEPNRPA